MGGLENSVFVNHFKNMNEELGFPKKLPCWDLNSVENVTIIAACWS